MRILLAGWHWARDRDTKAPTCPLLIKHQAVPAGTVYLVDSAATLPGYGFQLQAGESVEWPAKDVAEIFAFADAPGRVLLITRF